MKDSNKIKIIDNIDSKLKILYKNMTKNEYYKFLDSNDDIRVYNDLLNNISANNLPVSYLVLLPTSILLEINAKVFNQLCLFTDSKKELVLS